MFFYRAIAIVTKGVAAEAARRDSRAGIRQWLDRVHLITADLRAAARSSDPDACRTALAALAGAALERSGSGEWALPYETIAQLAELGLLSLREDASAVATAGLGLIRARLEELDGRTPIPFVADRAHVASAALGFGAGDAAAAHRALRRIRDNHAKNYAACRRERVKRGRGDSGDGLHQEVRFLAIKSIAGVLVQLEGTAPLGPPS